jgi:hypothetical protein
MLLKDVYEMPLFKDTEYTKLTPHDDCVKATILWIGKIKQRGERWVQTVTVMDETCCQEYIYCRTELAEGMLVRGQDEGKEAIWRLRAKKDEHSEILCGYPKEVLKEKGQ